LEGANGNSKKKGGGANGRRVEYLWKTHLHGTIEKIGKGIQIPPGGGGGKRQREEHGKKQKKKRIGRQKKQASWVDKKKSEFKNPSEKKKKKPTGTERLTL